MPGQRRARARALVLLGALVFACLAASGCTRKPRGPAPGSEFTLAVVDFEGQARVLGNLPGSVFAPRVSPDGKRVVFELDDPAAARGPRVQRLYVADLDRIDERRALPLVGTRRNWAASWTRAGDELVFLVSGEGPDTLWRRRADGVGEATSLVQGLSAEGASPDGRHLSFITLSGDRDYAISLVDLGSGEARRIIDRPGSEQHSSHISPDGRFIAYASNESGAHEVWVEPMPPDGRRWRITRGGGSHPVWAANGRALYYDRASFLFRVPFDLADDGEPRIGESSHLPVRGFQQGYRRRQFDVMPDGSGFLLLYPLGALR